MENETYLTIKEAAEQLAVTEGAIRNATLEGRLPFIRKYGRKLISHDDLRAYKDRTQPEGIKPSGRPPRRTGEARQ